MHLVEQAGWLSRPSWGTKDYSPFLAALSDGQQWAFRLAANPTRCTQIGHWQQSKRVGPVTVDQQRQWFLDRCKSWGIQVMPVDNTFAIEVRNRNTRSFRHGESKVSLSTAVFEGQLRVTEPDLLRHALVAGIGPGKAYGCGLMTLARLHNKP
jgi:CRISPR system Cascade subunit CasE